MTVKSDEHPQPDKQVTRALIAFEDDSAVLAHRPVTLLDVDALVHEGFPSELVEGLAALPCLQDDAVFASVFGLTRSTYRAYLNGGLPLSRASSDRLWCFAVVFGHLQEIFEDRDKAQDWLIQPHPDLGDHSPLSLLASAAGFRRIEDVLDSLEDQGTA